MLATPVAKTPSSGQTTTTAATTTPPRPAVRSTIMAKARQKRKDYHQRKRRSSRRQRQRQRHERDQVGRSSTIKRLSVKLKRGVPGAIPLSLFKDVPETWQGFLDVYGKCDKNLSDVERPECAGHQGFMAAPTAYNESKRAAMAKNYLHRSKWRDTQFLDKMMAPLREKHGFRGASVSIINRDHQNVKYQVGLDLDQISRHISIDAHALLSRGAFAVPNASLDWRFIYNPFVHGPPFIRAYIAVPLKGNCGVPIGVLALFDPFPRPHYYSNQLKSELADTGERIMAGLDGSSTTSPRIESPPNDDDDNNNNNADENSPYFTASHDTTTGALRFNGQMPATNCLLKSDVNTLRNLNRPPNMVQSYSIGRQLTHCLSARGAAERASEILAQTLGLDFVYVLEVRMSKVYQIASALLLPFVQTTGEVDVSAVGSEVKSRVHTRLFGGYGMMDRRDDEEEEKFDEEIHVHALLSTYGTQYDAPDEQLSYRSGIFMPFKRTHDQVVHASDTETKRVLTPVENNTLRQDTLHNHGDNHIFRKFTHLSLNQALEDEPPLQGPLQVKVRRGGYVMAGFSIEHRSFSPNDVEYMKTCVRELESLFT